MKTAQGSSVNVKLVHTTICTLSEHLLVQACCIFINKPRIRFNGCVDWISVILLYKNLLFVFISVHRWKDDYFCEKNYHDKITVKWNIGFYLKCATRRGHSIEISWSFCNGNGCRWVKDVVSDVCELVPSMVNVIYSLGLLASLYYLSRTEQ